MIIPEEYRSMMIRGVAASASYTDLVYKREPYQHKIECFLSTGNTQHLNWYNHDHIGHCSICGIEYHTPGIKTCVVCQTDGKIEDGPGFIPSCDCGEDLYIGANRQFHCLVRGCDGQSDVRDDTAHFHGKD